ncbi:transketolase [Adlercreutzia aquisgranensis]|uniref:transketolase n=1 Tax=Adlercreutzia aquisgranensis TaxID=2941323 RepID=UPI00203FE6D1|nr:transketolase [Adlercreutzia aquisgranensis]
MSKEMDFENLFVSLLPEKRFSSSEIQSIAQQLRRDALKMIYKAGAGHPGASLSEAEIIAALYFRILDVDPCRPEAHDRDRFILSKGHGCPTLYAALARRNFFSIDELSKFRQFNSLATSYPNMSTPGIECPSGSLGNGLSVGVGMAIAGKLSCSPGRVFVLVGDGECQEGAIWEACMFASHHNLDNLVLIVDRNKLQINGSTEELLSIDPLDEKLSSFGWLVTNVEGNKADQVIDGLEWAIAQRRPAAIIAHTTKGKGVSFMEGNKAWHVGSPDAEQYEVALKDLA